METILRFPVEGSNFIGRLLGVSVQVSGPMEILDAGVQVLNWIARSAPIGFS
jgi:hypothetical protein